jgi:hypothetical protein
MYMLSFEVRIYRQRRALPANRGKREEQEE